MEFSHKVLWVTDDEKASVLGGIPWVSCSLSEVAMTVIHLDEYTPESNEVKIALDSNIIIAFLDPDQPWNRTTKLAIASAKKRRISFVYSVITRLEVQEYLRGCYLAKYLSDSIEKLQFEPAVSQAIRQELRNLTGPQSKRSGFTDAAFKNIRSKVVTIA